MYGPAMVESGGRVDGDDPEADPAPKRSDKVPFTYFANCPKLYQELDHAANSVGWVDLTACDENLALMCVRSQKPYLGFVHSETHLDLLRTRLENTVFEAFQTVGDSLFEAGLAEILKRNDDDGDAAGGGAGGEGSAGAGDAGDGSEGGAARVPRRSGAAGASTQRSKLLETLRALEIGG